MSWRSIIVMGVRARLLYVAVGVSCLLPSAAGAQRNANINAPEIAPTLYYDTAPGTGVLIFSVLNERSTGPLDRQALVKLVNLGNQSATFQTTDEKSQGVFTNIVYGNYDAEVSAVGYLTVHKDIQVVNSLAPSKFDIVLHRDPAAVNLDVTNAVMSPKARKETKRAVSLLKSGRLREAEKHLDEAYKADPSDPNLNFLLGYLYFQKRDFGRASTYLDAATTANPHYPQALTLLGRAGLERQDYPAARSALERAVAADEENWLPHSLLADAYLHEKNYDKARFEAQVAIAKGKSAANPVQLVLGQALVNLGHDREGIDALNLFLETSPRNPVAPQVRDLIAQVREPKPASAEEANSPATSRLSEVDSMSALPAPSLSVKSWQPPGVDDVKPALAPGVACPSEKVVEESGRLVQALVDNVTRFAAVEDLFHQALDEYGNPLTTEDRKFNYVAAISEPQPGFLDVQEYRADKLALAGYPAQIASTGFVMLALIFHPHMRGTFEMTCEGLGDWRGQASWLVHFRQRDDRPNRMHSYKVGNQIHAVGLKGRAWITADKFQIVRIEAEMISPMPEIRLLSEHQIVEYGPVPFEKKNTTLWLPKSAEIYFDFRKHRYYRRHSFDHYMLYSVDTEEKRKEPASTPAIKHHS